MMKRVLSLFLIFILAFSLMPVEKAYAFNAEYKETPLDGAWDWATTLGKSGLEKERVLAENKAERMKRHAEKVAKQAEKEAGKAASDVKKKLGF